MNKTAVRSGILPLSILLTLGCQILTNAPGVLVLSSPTASLTPTVTQTPTPGSSSAIATSTPPGTPASSTATPEGGTPSPGMPDLNGVWDDNGHLIVIVQNGSNVQAAYIEERICDHADGTDATTRFRHDFNATLEFEGDKWTLSGDEMTTCSWGYSDTSHNGVHQTSMVAVVSEDFNSITGDWYHFIDSLWVIDGLRIVRQFEGGGPVPTPTGFVLPTAAP